MPELPEVEHLRRSLEPLIVGRTLTKVRVLRRDVIATPRDPIGGFSRHRDPATKPSRLTMHQMLQDATIDRLERQGKQLAIHAEDGRVLLVHLGMTGALSVERPGTEIKPHTHATWMTDDGQRLAFCDPRRFGGLWTLESREQLMSRHWSALGPDALTVTPEALTPRLARARRPVKAALLDQRVIAGVGNIYADEACFRARVYPAAFAHALTPEATARLAGKIRELLRAAIDRGGSTLRDYRDATGTSGTATALHRVYGRAGQHCFDCETRLESTLIAGRTTVWCPRCQPDSAPVLHNGISQSLSDHASCPD